MGEITDFLLANLLDVTPDNLVIAWHVFSGAEGRLGRRIAERRAAHEPITPEWFTGIGVEYGIVKDRKQELEGADEAAGRGADAVRRDQQERQGRDVRLWRRDGGTRARRRAGAAGSRFGASMAQLTRAMIERTRQVEADMHALRARGQEPARQPAARAPRCRARLPDRPAQPPRVRCVVRGASTARRAPRSTSLSVAFCDIDNFKLINDTHGHSVGDRVIQAIAEHFKRISGDNCHVARHGGEEFVLLFRGLTGRARGRLPQRRPPLVRRSGGWSTATPIEPIGPVTFSGGDRQRLRLRHRVIGAEGGGRRFVRRQVGWAELHQSGAA